MAAARCGALGSSDAARYLAPNADVGAIFPALERKYSPDQPRVPAGNPDGGQWTDGSLKHYEISGWYGRPNEEFGGLTPRDYLRDKDAGERRRVGIRALIKAGVLKP